MEWYNSLAKPSWTPAPATISLIWTVLYPIILISFGFVFVQAFRGKIGWKVAVPFAVNLVASLLFMPGAGTTFSTKAWLRSLAWRVGRPSLWAYAFTPGSSTPPSQRRGLPSGASSPCSSYRTQTGSLPPTSMLRWPLRLGVLFRGTARKENGDGRNKHLVGG
jgi:hypothetical protein